jgi:hypothetical protein
MNSHVLAGYSLHDIQAVIREVFHTAEDAVIYAFALWALVRCLFFRSKKEDPPKPVNSG